jgi:hypothetical protein
VTRIGLDTHAAARTLGQLGLVHDAMDEAAGRLLTPHLGLFPPHVLAHLVPEQAALGGGLRVGGVVVQTERVRLAVRVAAFELADGGTIDPAVIATLREASGVGAIDPRTMGILGKGLKAINGIGTFSHYFELTLWAGIRLGQRGLPDSLKLPLPYFHGEYEDVLVGKLGGRVLTVAGIAVSLQQAYARSGATTPFGRGLSALLGTGVPTALDLALFRGAPVMSVADDVTGGIFTGSQDATIVLVESGARMLVDPASAQAELEAWSDAARAGAHGWAVQKLANVGYDLGPALYDGGQACARAGEAFGGALYDAGHATRSWIDGLHRPSWLGG